MVEEVYHKLNQFITKFAFLPPKFLKMPLPLCSKFFCVADDLQNDSSGSQTIHIANLTHLRSHAPRAKQDQ